MSNRRNVPRLRSRSARKKGRFRNLSSTAKVITVTLAVVIVIALAVAATIGFFLWRLSSSYNENVETIAVPFPDEELRPQKDEDDNSQNILLIGSDTRGEIDEGILKGPQDGRSDTIMLAHIPNDRDDVVFVSVMRDSWVDIPGYGANKVNAAMAHGGVPLTVQTLEALLDIRIDHVALIDFAGFRGLTDALGGVTVNNNVAFSSGGHDFAEGEITLNGDEALTFVRTRKAFDDGDYQRVRNQQKYMKGVARQLISRDTLSSPGKIINVVDELSPFLTVSEDLTAGYFVSLAPSMRDVRQENLIFITAPTEGPAWSDDGQSIVLLDPEGMKELREAFKTDTLAEYASDHS